MVLAPGSDPQDVAKAFMQSRDRVHFWVRRYREGGMAALRDLPRSGRPPRAGPERIAGIIGEAEDGVTAPKRLRADIRERTGVLYRTVSVRRMMRGLGMSPKVCSRSTRAGRTPIPYAGGSAAQKGRSRA